MESDIYEMMGTRAEGPPEAPPFDKRAWAERKRQERQEAFARADAAALRANSDPAALESYLRVAAALPHHSATNILLIADRMPGATRVGTADHWRRLGAAVKRGEKAIHIIEPAKEYVRDDGSIGVLYDVRKVFDVSQTTARARLPRKADPHAALASLVSHPPARIEPSDDLGGPSAEYDHAAGVIRVQRGLDDVSATAKSAERATLSRRRRPRFPAGGATALWPPALPRAAAQGALDRGVVEVRGPDLNLQRRGALGVPGRDRPARDLPSAELREPDRHRDVLCAERGQPPRGVRGPHDCPLSGSPSPSAASASRSFMR